MRRLLWLVLLLVACRPPAPSAPPPAPSEPARGGRVEGPPAPVEHVVIVSIDGLRPDFYLDAKYDAPTLKKLAAEGAHARGVESVFPSVTYPSHATIATGVRPGTHGILSNTQWTKDGPIKDWYWDADQIRAPPIWNVARDAKKTTAIVYWPVSVGAAADWVIPERWPKEGEPEKRELMARVSTPGLFEEVEKALGPYEPKETFDKVYNDEYFTKACALILKTRTPALTLLHVIQVDGAQHSHGRDHEEVTASVKRVDGLIALLLAALDEAGIRERTTVIITGDHGFINVQHTIYPNSLFKEKGWYRSGDDWDVIAHQGGAQAAIYVRKPELVEEVGKALEGKRMRDGTATFTLLDRDALNALNTVPDAAFAISAHDGYTVNANAGHKNFYGDSREVTGNHGPLPEEPMLHTGLILSGAGVRGGASLDRARLIDVAPTAARLLGLEMKDVEGRVLTELLQ